MNPHSDTLTTADGRTALRMRRRLAHPPQRVWESITRPAHLAHWFPSEVTVDLRPGGKIGFLFPGEQEPGMSGTVTDLDEPHVFAFQWDEDHLRWEITPEGDSGSLLTLTHTFGDRFGGASFASGWHLCLTALAQLLDGESVDVDPDGGELHEAYLEQFDLGRGTVLDDGIRFERQLVRPTAAVWAELAAGTAPSAGGPVPAGFTVEPFADGRVTEVREAELLEYAWDLKGAEGAEGRIRWEFGQGTGHGPRLVLTQTGLYGSARQEALDAWHTHLERLAARLLEMS
ncbi:SRPBCC family protein [Streptomyces monticola]|uniref:SRPBCC family protein n=1 Tax=Streptomyces monticola TaxID=2666263 RepID=A0ABW2JEG2_9ACTN